MVPSGIKCEKAQSQYNLYQQCAFVSLISAWASRWLDTNAYPLEINANTHNCSALRGTDLQYGLCSRGTDLQYELCSRGNNLQYELCSRGTKLQYGVTRRGFGMSGGNPPLRELVRSNGRPISGGACSHGGEAACRLQREERKFSAKSRETDAETSTNPGKSTNLEKARDVEQEESKAAGQDPILLRACLYGAR
eukprot:2054496-Rhodomonas_salina.1